MQGVFPARGMETQAKTVMEAKSDIKTPVIALHDQKLKRALYNVLKKKPQNVDIFPAYYLHFSHDYGPEFYKQLTSEEIIPVDIKGAPKGFKILNTKKRRNEVLDIMKMHMAALEYAQDRFFKIYNDGRKLRKQVEIQPNENLFFDAVENMFYEEV
jgi:phage terminase large subunit GpA-like protein